MKTSVKLMRIAIVMALMLGGWAKAVSAQSAAEHRTGQAATEASDGDGETDDDAQDPQAMARLQALAKITPEQARKVAEDAMGKPADKVEIENDGGSLVYAVSFGKQDVKVDAGNGQMLYTDNQNDEQNQTHPRSSIQLSGTNQGDGDGETNDDG